ncbi:hypothetical protein [Streptomyces hirsutus]|uniref:hypothetical protein n=1 Tax=Streptomyces hirsutus TaxID=35620 RepID=UPI003658B43C
MTEPLTTMEDPPLLGMPLPEPEPARGCRHCQYWVRQRAAARRTGDGARVSDCNVQIRRHPH